MNTYIPTSSFLSLDIASLTFIITKAHIRESLESPFSIECEGYHNKELKVKRKIHIDIHQNKGGTR